MIHQRVSPRVNSAYQFCLFARARRVHAPQSPTLRSMCVARASLLASVARGDHRRRSRHRDVAVRASTSAKNAGNASDDPYALLGVSPSASAKEIKSAYRKRALELHPDVNKAPDAAKRFAEVKEAYQTLIDPRSREAWDARRAGRRAGGSSARSSASGRGWSGGQAWDPFTSTSGPSGRTSAPEEPFYGFKEFFEDLEKDLAAREAKRPRDAAPKSLWEELYDIGEELVDFLESSAPKPAQPEPPAREPPRAKPKASDAGAKSAKSQTVDDMLADLKRDMGL